MKIQHFPLSCLFLIFDNFFFVKKLIGVCVCVPTEIIFYYQTITIEHQQPWPISQQTTTHLNIDLFYFHHYHRNNQKTNVIITHNSFQWNKFENTHININTCVGYLHMKHCIELSIMMMNCIRVVVVFLFFSMDLFNSFS